MSNAVKEPSTSQADMDEVLRSASNAFRGLSERERLKVALDLLAQALDHRDGIIVDAIEAKYEFRPDDYHDLWFKLVQL